MWSALWTPWVEPAVDHPPPRGRADWVLAAVVAAAAVVEAVVRHDPVWPPVAVGLGSGLAVAVLFRRTHPLLAVAVAVGGSAALDAATFAAGAEPVVLHSGAVVLVLVYSLFRWGAGRDAAMGLGLTAVGFLTGVTTDFPGATDTIGGAAVLLITGAAPDQLIQAVHAAVRGDALIDLGATARLLATFSDNAAATVPVQPVEALTEREEKVLLAVARGRTNAEIGAELHISTSTVKFHLAHLLAKLAARNRVELAMWAYETGRVH